MIMESGSELTTPLAIIRMNGTRQRQLFNWSVERKVVLRVEPEIAILLQSENSVSDVKEQHLPEGRLGHYGARGGERRW